MVNLQGPLPVSDVLIAAQLGAFEDWNRKSPGEWSLAQFGGSLWLPLMVTSKPTIEMQLYSALPVPADDVSLADVLEFKHRRSSELLALRSAMDDVYLDVIKAADVPRAKVHAIAQLESRIRDLHAIFDETWKSKFLSTIKIDLNADVAVKAAGAAWAAVAFDFDPLVATAIGAASAIKFDVKNLRRPELPEALKAYAYLHKIEKELV